jgi:kynurenine formamidase
MKTKFKKGYIPFFTHLKPNSSFFKRPFLGLLLLINTSLLGQQRDEKVGISPWGPQDEIGTLNLMTDDTRLSALSRISSGKTYDLSTEYFVGMPSFHALGDPGYQYWLTHTPNGTIVDNPNGLGEEMNKKVTYTGDAISMYTHMGTHIDALNHFGLDGKIWNGYTPEKHLGDKGWKKTGAETIPPVIARGVLIDVASFKGVEALTNNYRVTAEDLKGALAKQKVELKKGDVVLIRTGQMIHFKNPSEFLHEYPGISLDAVKWSFDFVHATADTLGSIIPGAVRMTIKDQTHNVSPEAIAPVLTEFFLM